MTLALSPTSIPLGASVPALTPHAISVSLPTWADNVGYEEGDKRVVDRMETGYPRFFIHRSIQKLAGICVAKFGRTDELCILLPSPRVAAEGKDFLANQTPSIPSRIVEFVICPSVASLPTPSSAPPSPITPNTSAFQPNPASSSVSPPAPPLDVDCIELQILLFDKAHWATAKAFWQHTGDGISSRQAERALAFLGETPAGSVDRAMTPPAERQQKSFPYYSKNRHYARKAVSASPNGASSSTASSSAPTPKAIPTTSSTTTPSTAPVSSGSNGDAVGKADTRPVADELLTSDLTTYLEERYGRNLPLFNAPLAKQALKRRIAGGLLPSDEGFGQVDNVARGAGAGKRPVREDDVYLYPGGMSAIWHAFDTCRIARREKGEKEGKSVCYGFPYTDTLKILMKWGPGCHFFGTGGAEDLRAFADLLARRDPSEPPVLALFCEFPSNPLLRSPDLVRLRELADQYGFVIVVDETIGNFINVEVAAFADIVVSSLTKIFSGDANVMGGSLILNPNGPQYDSLKAALQQNYEDIYYPEDAVYMERNSRDYRARIKRVNDNAFDVCEYLFSRSLADTSSPSAGKAIKMVYYPRYSTPETYEQAKRLPTCGKGGCGGLFSLTFTTLAASKAFYDALLCAKGPSLGTSFTLASPYTILAHYYELEWAAEYGVEEGLVRISVGQEEVGTLREWFERSVRAAEEAGGKR